MLRTLVRLARNILAIWGILNLSLLVLTELFPEQYKKLRASLGMPPEESATRRKKAYR